MPKILDIIPLNKVPSNSISFIINKFFREVNNISEKCALFILLYEV